MSTSPMGSQLENMNHILSLLRSNSNIHPPDVSLCLTKTERDIEQISVEIRRLEGKISALRVKQEGLEWRAFRYQSLLAPIRRLPPEILSRIFEFACQDGCQIKAKMSSSPAQTSKVCAGWRNTALHNSKLWSTILIKSTGFKHPLDPVKQLLTMHLEMSKQSPLFLTVWMPVKITPDNEVALFIVKALASHSNRW
ncbi:hypothetical protein D9758_008256 [Tetrapyrgos nigripes]|uniref:F-box domain-containing protein n=1 Tax=Tetrapyrgos nigripes TaxID=182062 RepID=A0A8H5G1I6_9AGAR|nr:hypothetical protein D9758_008256 [Tetrapyrgos nigripes]